MIYFILIYLILLPVSGYYLLKLFSKLTGINMFSAMAWAFSAPSSGRDSVRVLFYGVIFSYILAFTLLFVFLISIPKEIHYMNKYHAGGLLGYNDAGLKSMVYDPSEGDYVDYKMVMTPLPAGKFTETFEVILFYKTPSSEYYQATGMMSLPVNITVAFFILCILSAVYGMLYKLAEDYIDKNNVKKKLSYRIIVNRFKKITGLHPWKALTIFLSLLVLIIAISAISVKRLINHYTELYGSHQKTFRSALLKKVSPGDAVTGHVIRRFWTQESETETTEGARGKVHQKTKYHTVLHYIVEFRDLIQIPVYLDLVYDIMSDDIAMLDKPFPDATATVPKYFKEYPFIVNPDYSISLRSHEKKSQE